MRSLYFARERSRSDASEGGASPSSAASDASNRLPVHEVFYGFCHEVAQDLGGGHSESTYEHALLRLLYNENIPALRQVQWLCRTKNGDVLPAGIVDLEIAHEMIVELKIGSKIRQEHIQQLNRYLRAAAGMGSPVKRGAVVCFTSSDNSDSCSVLIHQSELEGDVDG